MIFRFWLLWARFKIFKNLEKWDEKLGKRKRKKKKEKKNSIVSKKKKKKKKRRKK